MRFQLCILTFRKDFKEFFKIIIKKTYTKKLNQFLLQCIRFTQKTTEVEQTKNRLFITIQTFCTVVKQTAIFVKWLKVNETQSPFIMLMFYLF